MTGAGDASDELERSFIRLLIGDVLASRERLATSDTQRHRRDTVRSTFAAIEGITWMYREHVREVAKDMGLLTPVADLALRERTFTVTEQGNLIEQVRFVTLPTIIRLATKQAQLIEPAVAIAFDGPGWSALRSAIDVRNRVTHPKSRKDLQVSDRELEIVATGFAWLLGATESVMAAINVSYRAHEQAFREIVNALRRRDQQIIDEYRTAIMRDEDD